MEIPKKIYTIDEHIKDLLFKAYVRERWAFSALYAACSNSKVLGDLLAYWRLLDNRKELKKESFARYRRVMKTASKVASKPTLVHNNDAKRNMKSTSVVSNVSARGSHKRNRITKSPYSGTNNLDQKGKKLVRSFIANDFTEANIQRTILHFSEIYKSTDLLKYITQVEKLHHRKERPKSDNLNERSVDDSHSITSVRVDKTEHKTSNETKETIVPWNAIDFKDGCICIYNFRLNGEIILKNKHHLTIKCKESKACFNEIKQYILSKLPDIVVTMTNNNIDSLVTEIDLKRAIRILDESEYYDEIGIKESHLIIPATYQSAKKVNSEKILRYLRKKKSSYLNYLANQQVEDKKIIPCNEFFCYDNVEYEEDAFIFSLEYGSRYYKLIFENVKASRASIMFIITKENYENGIKGVFEFMRSDYINKRQSLHYKSFDLSKYGILTYRCLNHDYFEDWKYRLQY